MTNIRFGRRLALPSTAQIKHEMRMMSVADALKSVIRRLDNRKLTQPEFAEFVENIAVSNNVSAAGIKALIDELTDVGYPLPNPF